MTAVIKPRRGLKALTSAIGAVLLALASIQTASAQNNTGGVISGRADS
jgi:hypothetical protein